MVLKYDAVVAALKDMFDKGVDQGVIMIGCKQNRDNQLYEAEILYQQQLEDWLAQELANYTGVHTKCKLDQMIICSLCILFLILLTNVTVNNIDYAISYACR
jgi:hypothetical protein